MHILLVCGSLGGGGAERVAVNLSEVISAQGHLVSLYYWNNKKLQTYEINKNVKLMKSRQSNFFSKVLGLREVIQKNSPDVVIGFTDIPNIVCYGALRSLKNRPYFIATIHSDLKFRDKNLNDTLKLKLVRRLHRKACLFSDKVIAVSDGAKESLIDYYRLPRTLVERIYNPILDSVNTDLNNETVLPPYRLVAAGRLTKAKNYPLLIKTVKNLIDDKCLPCTLDIYGEGELRKDLEMLISRMGMEKYINLKGFVPNLKKVIRDYDIFVMSSSWEGFGNVLVEALNAGLRVVSTNCPSGPVEILMRGKYGELTPVDEEEELALAIIRCLKRSPAQDSNDLISHLDNFTYSNITQEYMKVITRLLSPVKG